jgi:hypothetical protein
VAEWHAHIGARNAAHRTSSAVSAIHSDGELEDRLRWDIDPEALATLRSQRQQRDYVSCLHARAVLPALRALSQSVGRAVR